MDYHRRVLHQLPKVSDVSDGSRYEVLYFVVSSSKKAMLTRICSPDRGTISITVPIEPSIRQLHNQYVTTVKHIQKDLAITQKSLTTNQNTLAANQNTLTANQNTLTQTQVALEKTQNELAENRTEVQQLRMIMEVPPDPSIFIKFRLIIRRRC